MPVERLLSELLHREPATDADHRPESAVLHECRHCGSKFDDPISECPVCCAAEIATYEFSKRDLGADGDAGDASGDEHHPSADESEGDRSS